MRCFCSPSQFLVVQVTSSRYWARVSLFCSTSAAFRRISPTPFPNPPNEPERRYALAQKSWLRSLLRESRGKIMSRLSLLLCVALANGALPHPRTRLHERRGLIARPTSPQACTSARSAPCARLLPFVPRAQPWLTTRSGRSRCSVWLPHALRRSAHPKPWVDWWRSSQVSLPRTHSHPDTCSDGQPRH